MENQFLFKGAIYIPLVDMYDMRNRFYHPNLGRFIQTDPRGFDAGDMNLFRYCGDDPVDRSDPMGLSDVYLERDYDDRHAPGTYSVRDNGGRQVYRGRANENPFLSGELSNGVSPGEYRLLRRGNGWGPGFAAWHPAITGFNPHLKPGQPNSSYRNPALVHEKGPIPGRGDSSACITTDHEGLMATSNAMAEDEKVGKTTRLHITHKPITNVKRALLPDSNKPRKSGDKGVSTDSQPQPQQPRALTAAEIDAAHQAVGVPSLAAEAINFAPGKP